MSAEEIAPRNAVYKWLAGTKISAVLPPGETQNIVCLPHTATLREAIQKLSAAKILSVLISHPERGYSGFVDMLDVVTYILAREKSHLPAITASELKSLTIRGKNVGDEPVGNIAGISDRDPFEPVDFEQPAHALVELFALGIHRLPIYNPTNGEIVYILSQSSLCQFLLAKQTEHPEVARLLAAVPNSPNTNLREKLVVCKKTDTVLDVLVTISTALISAVPIVDENGDLVASFSASDLRGMIQENFSSFMLTVEEYLKTHSPRTLEPLTATSTETLKELLAKMLNQDSAGYRRHRVWIVEGKKPIGVFSMTDVMKIIRDNDQL